MKREQRRCERKYNRKLEIDIQISTDKYKTFYKLLSDSKWENYHYYRNKQHKTNSKEPFRLSKDLMGFNRDLCCL